MQQDRQLSYPKYNEDGELDVSAQQQRQSGGRYLPGLFNRLALEPKLGG